MKRPARASALLTVSLSTLLVVACGVATTNGATAPAGQSSTGQSPAGQSPTGQSPAVTSSGPASGRSGSVGASSAEPVSPDPAPQSSAGSTDATSTVPPAVIAPGVTQSTVVRLQGGFIRRGGTVLACPPYASAGVGHTTMVSGTPSELPEVHGCFMGIPVDGLDVGRLVGASTYGGATWGSASITARYDGQRLTVQSQEVPSRLPLLPDLATPCPEPPAGWVHGTIGDDPGVAALQHLVQTQPTRFGALAMSEPYRKDRTSTSTESTELITEVMVVGVTGDVAAEQKRLGQIFHRNLCVVHAQHSAAQVDAQVTKLNAALDGPARPGVAISWGSTEIPLGDPRLSINTPIWTPELQQIWTDLGSPPIQVEAWMTPVGP